MVMICCIANAQTPEYFGAGNMQGVTVTSSTHLSDTIWKMNPTPENTINGSGLDADYYEASRFLMQSTLGFNDYHVDQVLSMGMDDWLNNQATLPIDSLSPRMYKIVEIVKDSCMACGTTTCDPPRTSASFVPLGWWEIVSESEDLLRQRVAQALSQIIVVSRAGTSFSGEGDGLVAYYDIIQTHALGNYVDLLYEITLNPAMGEYLTHVNNPKTDTTNFIFPDENYAREILQLFTIGLWELNNDGTQKLDANGKPIPTYDNYDIAEYAKIFTGLSYGGLWSPYPQASCTNVAQISFGMSGTCADKTVQMLMYEDQHEPGEKYLLNGFTMPAGQTGLQEIRTAIYELVLHPNTAPFVSYRLIQRLVKSNPSPAYVARVANVFKDNGSGETGDLFAVVKAILMDEEARDCSYQMDEKNGKMREPLLRYTHFTRMMDVFTQRI